MLYQALNVMIDPESEYVCGYRILQFEVCHQLCTVVCLIIMSSSGLPLVLKFLKKFTLSLKVLKSNILPLNSLKTITFKTRLE